MAVVLFDVYGTLIDVHGIARLAGDRLGADGQAISVLWRQKQIDYTRLRTLGRRHRDFEAVTGDALDYAAERLGLGLTAEIREELLTAYRSLPPYADAVPALRRLRESGMRLGVLSNGTAAMLEQVLAAAGLGPLLDRVISVEMVQRYKVDPDAYALGPKTFAEPTGRMVFVSSNGWDVAGAGWFGYRTFWVNRANEPLERLGVAPDGRGRSLEGLVEWIAQQRF